MKQQKLSSFFTPIESLGNTVSLPSMMVSGMEIVFEQKKFPRYQESRLLWQKFNQRLRQIPYRVQKKGWEKWGILYHQFDDDKKKISKYLACVEVTNINNELPSMVKLQIPSLKWQKHTHRGALVHLPTTLNRLMKDKNQGKLLCEPTLSPSHPIFDHIEHYDHRFHWSKPSSEIDVYTLADSQYDNQGKPKTKKKEFLL